MTTSIEKWKFGTWKELESDPGLFTLLVEEFGCEGVEVEEVYDLDSLEVQAGDVYGLIFLFKWGNESQPNPPRSNSRRQRSHKNPDHEAGNGDSGTNFDRAIASEDLFFAHQLIPNSCASHALLSVLLNCSDQVKVGDFLVDLRAKLCNIEDPEIRGYALGNLPELAMKHNRFACYEPPCISELSGSSTTSTLGTAETFHYCCYVPHKGKLYELDGLKAWPINHGETGMGNWLEKAKAVISGRIARARDKEQGCHDIRYNLMSVVPSRKILVAQKIQSLKSLLGEAAKVLAALKKSEGFRDKEELENLERDVRDLLDEASAEPEEKRIKQEGDEVNGIKITEGNILKTIPKELGECKTAVDFFKELRKKKQIYATLRLNLSDEENKHLRYERDAERRSHDYGKFIQKFVEILQRSGALQNVIDFSQTVPQKPNTSRPRKKSKKGDS